MSGYAINYSGRVMKIVAAFFLTLVSTCAASQSTAQLDYIQAVQRITQEKLAADVADYLATAAQFEATRAALIRIEATLAAQAKALADLQTAVQAARVLAPLP
jgi:hypothetical protein